MSTDSFTNNAPAKLWAWHLNKASTAYFPTCILCTRICFDEHLTCTTHQARMHGLRSEIRFPSRELYCGTGVKFMQITTAHPEGEPSTREWLPADQPLPDKPPTAAQYRSRPRTTIEDIQISVCNGTLKHHYHDMPDNFTALITHSTGEQTEHLFTQFNAGAHRVAYTTTALPFVFKMQFLHTPKNHNKEEWNKSRKMGIMNTLIPVTYGYIETRIHDMDMEVSFLVLERAAYTLKDYVKLLSKTEPTLGRMAIVTSGVTTVVDNLVKLSNEGLKPYDWHVGNVAFEDHATEPKCQGFKLIDWAGNHTAPASMSLRERMQDAFMQFSGCFKDFKKRGTITTGQIHADSWNRFMKSMHHTLQDWWAQCASSQTEQNRGDLPNAEEFDNLKYSLQRIIEEHLSMTHVPRTESLGVEPVQLYESRGDPVEQQSSGSDVLDTWTAGDLTKPSDQMTQDTQQLKRKARCLELSYSTHLSRAETANFANEPWPTRVKTSLSDHQQLPNSCMSAPQTMTQTQMNTTCADVPAAWEVINTSESADRVGETATQGRLKTAPAMPFRIVYKEIRHGRATTASIKAGTTLTLGERRNRMASGETEKKAFPYFTPSDNRMEGDDIKRLFQSFLYEVLRRGHLQRMHFRPRVSWNTDRLHQLWWIPFTKDISWCTMNCTAKRKHIRQWLFMKFSNDGHRQVMSPGPRGFRVMNQMKWDGFDISDGELDDIINSMFLLYEAK